MKKWMPVLTPQVVVTRERLQRLLEIEEEENAVLDRLRKAVDGLKTPEAMATFIKKCVEENQGGRLSDRSVKRCRIWTKRKLESWRAN